MSREKFSLLHFISIISICFIFGASACGVRELASGRLEPPEITLEEMVIYPPESQCWPLSARLRLTNPNPEPLRVLGYDFTFALGNGSMELLYLLPRVFPQPQALLPAPGFSEYDYAVELSGLASRYVYLRPPAYAWDMAELSRAVAQGGLIFLCNPNNPTGTLLSREDLAELFRVLPETALLVMDEAFIDFVEGYENLTLVSRAVQDPRLLVLGSLTKFFALPGLRLGYLVGTQERIQKVAAQLPLWNINSLAQAAGTAALQDRQYQAHSREYIHKSRQKLYGALQTIPGLNPLLPTANFIFCRLGPGWPSAPQLVQLMGERGILVRDCSNYRGLDDRCIRVAVRRQRENEALVAALRDVAAQGV